MGSEDGLYVVTLHLPLWDWPLDADERMKIAVDST